MACTTRPDPAIGAEPSPAHEQCQSNQYPSDQNAGTKDWPPGSGTSADGETHMVHPEDGHHEQVEEPQPPRDPDVNCSACEGNR